MGTKLYLLDSLLQESHGGPQDLQGQAHPRQKGEAEQAHPPVDQDEDREHHPVQRQEEALEEDQAEALGSTSSSRAPARSPAATGGCSLGMKRVLANLHCC